MRQVPLIVLFLCLVGWAATAKSDLTEVTIEDAEIGVAERDQTTATKTQPLIFPASLPSSEVLEVDYQQKLLLRFTIKDIQRAEAITAHQAFAQLINQKTKQEIVFIAEPDASNVYKFELNVAARAKDFGHVSGQYVLSLIVGDASIANPFVWKVGNLKLTFPSVSTVDERKGTFKSEAPWLKAHYGPKPAIDHKFRELEKRPATAVSDAFTILVLLPLVLLFILWAKIGINFSNLPFTVSAFVFHVSLAAIFGLYFLFWLQLDMFTTLKCLVGTGVVTFLSGHSLLSRLAARNQKSA